MRKAGGLASARCGPSEGRTASGNSLAAGFDCQRAQAQQPDAERGELQRLRRKASHRPRETAHDCRNGVAEGGAQRLTFHKTVRVIDAQKTRRDFSNIGNWNDGHAVRLAQAKMLVPSVMARVKQGRKPRCAGHKGGNIAALAAVAGEAGIGQIARLRQTTVLFTKPPCFSLMMWSTSPPKYVSSSWSRQYSQRKSARRATCRRRAAGIWVTLTGEGWRPATGGHGLWQGA